MNRFIKIMSLFSSIKCIREYLVELDEQVLTSKRPSENNKNNHCVYEERLYKKILEGGSFSINDLLKGLNGDRSKGIVVISAPSDGYAKDFFAIRMVTMSYDIIKSKADRIHRFLLMLLKKTNRFYLPIIIEQKMIETSERIDDKDRLFTAFADSIRQKCVKYQCNEANEYEKLKEFLRIMAAEGHILLLLPRSSLEVTAGLFTLLVDTLVKDSKGNLLVYITEDENIFFDPKYCYMVKLDSLTKEEILAHIEFVNKESLFFFENLMNDNEFINNELQIPERLLFMSNYLAHNTYKAEQHNNEFKEIKTVTKFYEILINNCIERCLQKACNLKVSKSAMQIIRNALSQIAWNVTLDIHVQGNEETINKMFISKLKKSVKEKLGNDYKVWEHLTKEEFFLVNEKGEFRFEGCRHYLVAEKIFQNIKRKSKDIAQILCTADFFEKRNLQIYQFLIDLVNEEEKDTTAKEFYFRTIWNSLIQDKELGKNNRIQVLFNILEQSDQLFNVVYLKEFSEVILKELSNKYYDNNIFDTIQSINNLHPELDFNHYLKEQYKTLAENVNESIKYIDTTKRRLAYFFGKERCGIIDEMIEDLINPYVHIHVKYHIILAVIESYDLTDTEEILEKFDEKIRSCENEWKKDCILYSDYLELQAKRNGVIHRFGSDIHELQNQLFKELREGKYWSRAHAAGALGRQGLLSSKKQLMDQLKEELSQVQAEKESLKAVSYITEAVCELFFLYNQENNDGDRVYHEIKTCIEDFMNLIDSTLQLIKSNKDIETIGRYLVAFATIAEGINYLIKEVKEKKADDIGKHIKDGQKNVKENCFAIESSFISANDKYNTILTDIGEKLKNVQEVLDQSVHLNGTDSDCNYSVQEKSQSEVYGNSGMHFGNNTSNGFQQIVGDSANVTNHITLNVKK